MRGSRHSSPWVTWSNPRRVRLAPLGVFFKLRREFSHGYFQPRVLARQAGLLLVALLDIKRPRGMRQKLITPLIIQGYWASAPVRG